MAILVTGATGQIGNAIARENLASLYIWNENISVEPDLLKEMRVQFEKYRTAGNTKNADALLKRIE